MTAINIPKVNIYTDGACSGNPGPGGWGVLLEYQQTSKIITKEYFGYEVDTTNNRMELMAAIKALDLLKTKCFVSLYTDSKYLQQGITVWIKKWLNNNWQRDKNTPVKNADLWQTLHRHSLVHQISWYWVKGHANNNGNIIADRLAVQGRDIAVQKYNDCK